jgi:thiosulfate dehydrogenase
MTVFKATMTAIKTLHCIVLIFFAASSLAEPNIQARPADYLLQNQIVLSAGQVLPAGTRWYQPPDINRLKREIANASFQGDQTEARRILFGYELITNTYASIGEGRKDGQLPLAQGKIMNCSSCHAGGGIVPFAYAFFRTLSFYGLREKGDKGIYFEGLAYHRDARTRARDCGRECGGPVMLADNSYEMDALMAWLKAVRDGIYPGEGLLFDAFKSKADVGKIPGAQIPLFPKVLEMTSDPVAGKSIYDARCLSCHENKGVGQWSNTRGYIIPPLAGKGSFSQAGGPLMVPVGAAFIQRNMPPDNPGTLTPQEALDAMAYIASLPRPSVWWQDYFHRHNPCARPAFLPLHVGTVPQDFPFSKEQTQFGPWQAIADWLNSDACKAANPVTPAALEWDFTTLTPIW